MGYFPPFLALLEKGFVYQAYNGYYSLQDARYYRRLFKYGLFLFLRQSFSPPYKYIISYGVPYVEFVFLLTPPSFRPACFTGMKKKIICIRKTREDFHLVRGIVYLTNN